MQEQWPDRVDLVAVTPSQGAYVAGTGVWSVGDLAVEGRAELVLTGRVGSAGVVENVVRVSSAAEDPDTSDDSASVTVQAEEFPPPTEPPAPPPPDPGSGSSPGSGSGSGSLPNTGGPSLMLVLFGLLSVLAGGRLLRRQRRRG